MTAIISAALGLMVQGCAQRIELPEGPFEYTFAVSMETRSTLSDDNIIVWESGDMVGTYAPGSANLVSEITAGTPATFKISLATPVTAGETLHFYAPYSGNAGSDPTCVLLTIPQKQDGTIEAMPMAALPHAATEAFAGGDDVPGLKFCNLASVMALRIYSDVQSICSEEVTSVEFTATDGICGDFVFDLTAADSDLTFDAPDGKTLSLIPSEPFAVGASVQESTREVIVLAPGTHSGTLTVSTDKASYSFDIPSRSFDRSGIRTFNLCLTMENRTPYGYVRQSSADAITSGTYIIAADIDGTFYALPNTFSSTGGKASGSTVTVTDDTISEEDGEPYKVELTVTDGKVFINTGSAYLAYSGSGTDIYTSASSYVWTVSESGSGLGTFRVMSGTTSRALLFRSDSYKCFGGYSTVNMSSGDTYGNYGTYHDIEFFKLDTSSEDVGSDEPSGETPVIVTGDATYITSSGAKLAATFYNTTSTPREICFSYGTSASSLTSTAYFNDTVPPDGTEFTVSVEDLAQVTTYYYRVSMQIGDTVYYGEIKSFTTLEDGSSSGETGWLELPAITGAEDYVGTFYGSNGERNYTYNYDYDWYCSLWTAYPLCSAHMSGSASSSWKYNPNISEEYQISIVSTSYGGAYGQSTYARGHQVPNADRKSDSKMNSQTYYATNQTPQIQNTFNGTIWSTLENSVRTVAKNTDTLYVVTGATFRKVGGSETITYFTSTDKSKYTPASLPVPNYYWKVLLKVSRNSSGTVTSASTIGVWMDHKSYSSNVWSGYVTSVDQIEAYTGFDFFVNLPDAVESAAESNSSWSTFNSF